MSIPLTSIRATLERHLSLTEGYLPPHIPSSVPLFNADATLPPSTTSDSVGDYASHISSFGLPASLASEVVGLIARESQQYRVFVEQMRLRQLRELSTTSVSSDPSSIPALLGAACNKFNELLIKSGIEEVQQLSSAHESAGSDVEQQSDFDDDSDTSSDSQEEANAAENDFDDDDEEDDNAPIKPGEDVPPLETKYLPIFEALHERGKVLTKPEKTYLVNMTGMTYRQITIWFQNRRRGELKESMNMSTSYSKASSTHSDETSEFSDQELEKNLGAHPANTTFDIRSWRLQSALATRGDCRDSIPPLSPLKHSFPSTAGAFDTDNDTDLSDDSDDDISMPPGLQAPSLTTSITTVDSISTHSTSASIAKDPTFQSTATTKDALLVSQSATCSRPIRNLPLSRRGSPPTSSHQMQHRYSHTLNTQSSPQDQSHQASDTVHPPSQSVFSDEKGLTVNLDIASQLRPSTLALSSVSAALALPNTHDSGHPSISPSPPPASAGSPQRQTSPASSISPRPHIRPLPRRTGCAPRPRPPPRSGPSGPTPAPGSSRPSVVLPPSSNPSLGNTTLGALLRPNPPAPAIPRDIEERLTAMAGRMGVGANSNSGSGSAARQITSSSVPRGGTPGSNVPLNHGAPFTFGPTSLPRTNISSGTRPVPGQTTRPS